jgi:serralysin
MPTTSFTATQAAAQITRSVVNGVWLPALNTPITLSYAYRATAPAVYPYPGLKDANNQLIQAAGFVQMTAAEIAVAERAFKSWSDIANIAFTRVGTGTTGPAAYSDNANLLLANFSGPPALVDTTSPTAAGYGGFAFRYWQNNSGVYSRQGEVWYNNTLDSVVNPVFGGSFYRLSAHEIGHAIGLSHPGPYDIATGPVTYANSALYIEDSWQYSIMSYFDETNTGANFGGLRPFTPMMHDIAAAQRLYGANMTTRTGDTIYGWNSNAVLADGVTADQIYRIGSVTARRIFCIWDAGGTDTIDGSGYAQNELISLVEGTFSNVGPLSNIAGDTQSLIGNISIAYGAVIENATGGSGNDTLIGNAIGNTLIGNAGNDILSGGAGADAMFGGIGDDTYSIDDFGDHAFENANEGTDTVNTSVSYVMEANIENVNLLGLNTNDGVLGNALANIINGNGGNNGIASGDGNDTINAGAGNDVLDGQSGADAMSGGLGSDVYFVDNLGDTVLGETAQAGVYDTVWTTVSFTLPSEVEILILNGGTLAINGTGSAGAGGVNPNLMLGNNAANALTTFGGDDIIVGLDGNDTISAGGSSLNGYNLIVGGNGSDLITTGSGHDFVAYNNISEAGDTINGFSTVGGSGLDILDLRTMFTTFTGFAGVGAGAAVTSGHLTFTPSGSNTEVYADANGGTHNAGEQILLATLTGTTAAAVQTVTLV